MTISLIGDVAVDHNGSWLGTMASACTRLYGVCVGGTGHLRTSTTAGVASDVAMLATIEVPLHLRRLLLIPGLGIGAGRDVPSMTGAGMQSQPDTWSARGEARIVASYPLARWVFVDLAAGVVGASSVDQQQNQTGDNASSGGPALLFELGAGLRLGAP